MVNNELVLLDQVLQERQAARPSPIPEDEAFEIFACEQALKQHDLSSDEIADGVAGGGNDGGIDGIYLFLGGQLVSEDSDIFQEDWSASTVPTNSLLELIIVQAKREKSFAETAIVKVIDSTQRLLNLAENEEDLRQLYADPVVTRTGLFRNALHALATRHPKVSINFVYATRGSTGNVNTKVLIKSKDLEAQFSKVITGASGNVEFLGCAELWQRTNTSPSYTTQLTYQETATSGQSYVALVRLRDYMEFLTDENGQLRRHIFDCNVRDYQGNVEVNREIRKSLEIADAPEFWWLNNGVTIVCSKASAVSKTYSLDDVQIVNGLQTSQIIYNVLHAAEDNHPALDRSVLVRILVTGDDTETRDRVIRATNQQTSVPAASLRATDDIQRDIEKYFMANDWFYDRRKNFYRNSGKPPERIIGIPLLAQAIMAMGLSRPDDSRARPSSLLKRDEDYKTLFSAKTPLDVYLWLAIAQKTVDAFLRSDEAGATPQERTNLRFHLAMVAVARLVGHKVYAPSQLIALPEDGRAITDAGIMDCLTYVRGRSLVFSQVTGYALDRIAKGQEFVADLIQNDPAIYDGRPTA